MSLGRVSLAHHWLSTASLTALMVALEHTTPRLRTVRPEPVSHTHLPQEAARHVYTGMMGGTVLTTPGQQVRLVVLSIHSDSAVEGHVKVAWWWAPECKLAVSHDPIEAFLHVDQFLVGQMTAKRGTPCCCASCLSWLLHLHLTVLVTTSMVRVHATTQLSVAGSHWTHIALEISTFVPSWVVVAATLNSIPEELQVVYIRAFAKGNPPVSSGTSIDALEARER